jgi:hypothetical protein
MSRFWPYVRTTAVGRVVLRMAWELFGVAEINERTWKDVSARLWKASERGFYRHLLRDRARVVATLVDGQVEAEMRPHCVPIQNCDPMLEIADREDFEAVASSAQDPKSALKILSRYQKVSCTKTGTCRPKQHKELSTTYLDDQVATRVRQAVRQEVAAFKVTMLPEMAGSRVGRRATEESAPSAEEVMWAVSRVLKREKGEPNAEAVLRSYLWHSLLERICETG